MRSETVTDKPAYRDAFMRHRCLIPADGFFEWRRDSKEKQPFHFGMHDDSLFAFAALWDRWTDERDLSGVRNPLFGSS